MTRHSLLLMLQARSCLPTSAIRDLAGGETHPGNGLYDLMGRKVKVHQKGQVYIMGGKKIIFNQ